MEKLKPCPFCGKENLDLTHKGNDYTRTRSVTIRCKSGCNVKMTVGAIRFNLDWCEEKAIEGWNQRINNQ